MSLITHKITALASVVVALFVSSLNAQAASESATVNITAEVADNTCTPEWGSSEVNVLMGKASQHDFTGKGKVVLSKPFTLKLKDCGDAASQVTVTASGLVDAGDADAFANTLNAESGGAGGVAILLYGGEDQSKKITPNGATPVTYKVISHKVDMNFTAKLEQSSAAAVTAGNVKSVVTMQINYE
ncbi:type 1 fimbrial protein [Erwiniaceae bacterium BAC15a-03b]|uniref:Type 1 fimbrial protein n=1 Tax=Winslowiella arboricola TaxID=2978220 RepID=A0A9J6PTP7_9GAMM|nr:fimbrial protein [Winslowiella arboricola]MCU5774373.1 type 1 fimbrial protein [Winslowiella arboricola]MCU5778920.1 type 1 fimbrial protein [Winslowiella arboricola]